MSARLDAEVIVVGAGVVGLATAYALVERGRRVMVLDKENQVAAHQSGHNSGVIHSGLYYRPGSLKAKSCRAGRAALLEFCRHYHVPHEVCGKVVVAVDGHEKTRLPELEARGKANGIDCRRLTKEALRSREPHLAPGAEALLVEDTGIVDYVAFAEALRTHIQDRGSNVLLGRALRAAQATEGRVEVETDGGRLKASRLVNCAGLHSDRVARACGAKPEHRIIPFRGEYGVLRPGARQLCRHLIYPVPDPRFPFLGVHLTRTVTGEVECGPSAVLAFAREGYRFERFDFADMASTLGHVGFWRFVGRHWRTGLVEMARSLYFPRFVSALRRLVPELSVEDVVPAPAGVRAQAMTQRGELVDDFAFSESQAMLHVVNAPSPAATASLAIGSMVADRLQTVGA
ncbi:MAG: L-2-hydroxyglutarate oxidase [Myxococcota bacterium]